ncbi:9,11-endoperoxide prostaglandin H2 reductase [Penicillium oxalicum]|uniref:9,11-endoperoxide prostaglandin H2 reductase n=1 Tax=Penicillium oxalicum TaxID=69781 RepID=UPI0020B80A68|nr:9,11-endoperoxide prostaglandin H2 reductase [Penicillium oxalicum]KAI2790191.1 9,11-endoperoxide prostaglandin H2 reductase [Penicillium oxalicum]
MAYGNEAGVGAGIRDSGVPREDIWITTKLRNNWHNRAEQGLDASLAALGVEYVDLYLMHWPVARDPTNPARLLDGWDFVRTWHEMQKLLATNKVRNIGVSNFGITNLEILLHSPSTTVVPAVNQIELHPYNPSPKLVAYNTSKGIHTTGYSCLGSGRSTIYADPVLIKLAAAKGKTPQQVLLMWGIQKGWSVIPKSVNEKRLEWNLDLNGWCLETGEMKELDGVTGRVKILGDGWLPVKVFFGDDE